MDDKVLTEISAKLNALIALSIKRLSGEKDFEATKKRSGIGEKVRFLADFGLDAKDISKIIGAPLPSVRTLLTPKRRK